MTKYIIMMTGSAAAVAITTLAGAGPTTLTFTNPGSISIPDGTAFPYPGTLVISDLSPLAGLSITDVDVTLNGLSHQLPDDLDILIEGPTGATCLIMSDCGGGITITDVELVFDDDALVALPDSSPISSGTYLPSNYQLDPDDFAPMAPAGPYGTSLSVFTGTEAAGSWRIWIMDDGPAGTGILPGGWSLTITAVPTPGALALLGLSGVLSTRRRRA